MLVLSQRKGQSTHLLVDGPDGQPITIIVTIVELRPGVVKIGYTAPKTTVTIRRAELLERDTPADSQNTDAKGDQS